MSLEKQGFAPAVKPFPLELWYQPVYWSDTGKLLCNEVLLRVREENGTLVRPGPFLAAADREGTMPLVDRYVLSEAVAQLRTELRLRLSVNLSAASLDSELAQLIEDLLTRAQIAPERLGLEVSSQVIEQPDAIEFIARLRRFGCPVALDDFDVASVSFPLLRRTKVDFVKIEGNLLRNLTSDPVDRAVIAGIHGIVRALGARTVAKSVENAETLQQLRALGVDCVQGYHLKQPDAQAGSTAIPASARRWIWRLAIVATALYLIKSALGIDFFPSLHLSDLPGVLFRAIF